EGEDRFDTDVALSTGELRQLMPALIEALGGELSSDPLTAAGQSAAANPGTGTLTQGRAMPATADTADDSPPF
ncbi:MAG: recombination-associated protein RdgC, partial [Hydrogenophaga sp.]